MNYFYIDTSALVKRLYEEPGTEVIDFLLDHSLSSELSPLFISIWGISEAIAVLNRKKNKLKMNDDDFHIILQSFIQEVIKFYLVTVKDEDILTSCKYALKYNLNSADAYYLSCMVEIRNILQPLNQNLVLISSDTRFLNAAEKEGFKTLNPEKNTKDEVLLLLRLP